MEVMEAAARPARSGSQGSRTGNRTASPMQVTSAMERNGPEPQPDNGPLLRSWICPQEDRTSSLMAPKPPRAWALQLQGSSVLESKVRALKDKMTAGKLGTKPCPTSQECSSSKNSKCHQIKPGVVQGSPLPAALVVPQAQNLTDGQLDSSANEKETAKNGSSRLPRPPAPGLECWNGQNPCSSEATWTLPDHEKDPSSGSGSLQENPIHQVSVGQPQGPGPYKVTHMPSLKKEKPYPCQDGLVIERDLDSTALTAKEDLVPKTDLLEWRWRAGDLGSLGTESNDLSLSDRVEKNRLLLQEMLKVSGQSSPKVGSPAETLSWDRATLERPAGDVDWDSGTPLQDSGQSRTFPPNPEPVLSTRHEEAKHLLRHSRMKARTQPLRASHDIVPTIAQGSRNSQRSPALNVRTTSAYRDSFQNGSLSHSSSRESSSVQWPKRGTPLSHVRFEDESAREAEFRYLERLQQRQVLSTVLQAVGQGPLRSKPDLTNYINHDTGDSTFHMPLNGLDCNSFLVPPPAWDSQRKCHACGSHPEECCPTEGKAVPDLRVLQGLQATCGAKAVLLKPSDSHGLSSPFLPLPAEPGLHTEWNREIHIRDTTSTFPEKGDSVLDSTYISDSCGTDGEEARTSQPSRAGQQGSRLQRGHRWSRKASMELPQDLQAWPLLPGVDGVVVEVKGARGHMPQGTWCLRDDAVPKPSALEPETPSLGSHRQSGSGLGSHCTYPENCWAPCSTVYAMSSMKLGSSGSGREQVTENHESLEILCTPSLQQSYAQPSVPHPALPPTSFLSPEDWIPTPPSSRKSPCPKPLRKSAPTGHRRQEHQMEPMGVPLPLSPPRTVGLTSSQTQLCRPQVKHPLLDLSNNCNNGIPLELQESWGVAVQKDRVEKNLCCQEPGPALESTGDAITLSLTMEEPESCQELARGLQRIESSSGGHMPTGASPGVSAGPRPPPAAPSDGNKKRSNSIASTLGLKKLFSALGHTSRPKLRKFRSYSVEQLQPVAPASHTSTPKVKKAPSLQTLHLVSPSHQHRKAASFQNLHSLLSGKGDRSSLYLVEGSGDPNAAGRPAKTSSGRALSVEDVGAPSLARTVGRVVEVFPDGTSQLQLQRPLEGTFGFCVAYGNGRRDSGLYVQAMADLDTAKLYSGLLGVGDEILEVNGAKVAGLGLAHIKELLAHMESLSIRVLRQRPVPQ
ncbi:uncharacterized protein KIAA1614 homolog isoform X3 [Nannospalax galili]|uniref:uncharacterized protein KIAA1614 homolog isoform X3 n=1 Tax=Nannospalax galili TaxID=1026970 RepID=UPI000819A917|nr:uncharacterized protein KIAA1614 homolog isoform X3 [Nannospalax galili]